MSKLGWRDPVKQRVDMRLEDIGLKPELVKTMFDFIELDEGRTPHSGGRARVWLGACTIASVRTRLGFT